MACNNYEPKSDLDYHCVFCGNAYSEHLLFNVDEKPVELPYGVDFQTLYVTGLPANGYQKAANRTARRKPIVISPEQSDLLNWTTGLTGEAGEVADLIKKAIFHGHEMDREKLKKELGDVLWYVAAFCYSLICLWKRL